MQVFEAQSIPQGDAFQPMEENAIIIIIIMFPGAPVMWLVHVVQPF